MKLWKVTANGAGWMKAATFYFDSKEKAIEFDSKMRNSGKCSDGVEYAGNYKPENAKELLSITEKEL